MKKILPLIHLFLLLPLFFFLSSNNSYAGRNLELWIHPYLPAVEIIKKFSPLADYLSDNLGSEVEIKVSKNYEAHMKRIGEDNMDLAYLGPVPYVKVTRTYGSQIILACLEVNGSPFFHGLIIARKDSGLEEIQDLIGKNFAFGDPNSTMSYLLPRYMLRQSGVSVDKLNRYEFLGSHHNVALGVLGGYYDAGGVKEGVYLEYKDRGLKIIKKSQPIPEHLFIANSNLPQEKIATLRRLLLNLQDKSILTPIKKTVTGMVSIRDEDYNNLRTILEDLDKSGLD